MHCRGILHRNDIHETIYVNCEILYLWNQGSRALSQDLYDEEIKKIVICSFTVVGEKLNSLL